MPAHLIKKYQFNNRKYAHYVKLYADSLYSLSYLLLKQSEAAEQVTTHTFLELYEPFSKENWNPSTLSLHAYQSCIRQCTERVAGGHVQSVDTTTLDEKALEFLWYGLKLPLTEITVILHTSIPSLKEQLIFIRERARSKVSTSTVQILPRKNLDRLRFIYLTQK